MFVCEGCTGGFYHVAFNNSRDKTFLIDMKTKIKSLKSVRKGAVDGKTRDTLPAQTAMIIDAFASNGHSFSFQSEFAVSQQQGAVYVRSEAGKQAAEEGMFRPFPFSQMSL